MALFDPWQIGAAGNGLLGGFAPQYTEKEIAELIKGYGPQWGNLPPAMSPSIPGDPSGSTPMGAQAWNSPLMPQATATMSTEPAITNPPEQRGSWVRPGSLLDKFITNMQAPIQQSFQTGTQGAQAPMDLAQFAPQTGGFDGAPRQVSVPMPPPRPNIPQAQTEASAQSRPLDITPNAQLPPNAQPTQGYLPQQAQQQPPQQEPSFLDRLSIASHNMAGAPGFMPGVFDAIKGGMTGQRTDKEGRAEANQRTTMNAVYQGLISRNIPPQQAMAIAQAAAIDPKIAEQLLPQALGLKPPSTVEGVIAERMHRNPQGGVAQSGYDELTKLEQAKARGQKAGGVEGERVANAQLDLPSAVAQSQEALRLIGELRTHKGRDNGVFFHSKPSAYLPDSAIPGNTDARDAVTILNQLKGGAFLEAFKALKGGGAITEIEGKKATDAIARMDRSQSRAEFDKALSDYEGVIRLGIDRASQMAGQKAPNEFRGNAVKPGQYDWTPGSGLRQRGQ